MKNLNDIQNVYLIGIGGIGMSALAKYFKHKGCAVSGYDRTSTVLTRELEAMGIKVHYEENLDLIPTNPDLVIYTPAISNEHKELQYFIRSQIPVKKRSETLELISNNSFTIAVAGTHGKTSTTALIAHLLHYSGIDCTAFVGGIMKNYNSNLILSNSSNIVVVEADEYDRSFLRLHPDIAVVTSIDADHLDIYETKDEIESTFRAFINQIKPNGVLVYQKSTEKIAQIGKLISYGLGDATDYNASQLTWDGGNYFFSAITPNEDISNIAFKIPGKYNIENALAAIAVAKVLNISNEIIKQGLESFQGLKRRFDFVINSDDVVYIDDYAHHPEEIKAVVSAIRSLYPDKKIAGIFQPHLFSRTRDFMDEFAQSLALLDELYLLDIYPARELPIDGITSDVLLEKVDLNVKQLSSKKYLVDDLKFSNAEVYVTMGAGNIDTEIDKIANYLNEKFSLVK